MNKVLEILLGVVFLGYSISMFLLGVGGVGDLISQYIGLPYFLGSMLGVLVCFCLAKPCPLLVAIVAIYDAYGVLHLPWYIVLIFALPAILICLGGTGKIALIALSAFKHGD